VRPLPAYDYSLPPHTGQLNYERWQWPMTGNDVCRAFVSFLDQFREFHRAEAGNNSQSPADLRS
jgi:hypothetical protein